MNEVIADERMGATHVRRECGGKQKVPWQMRSI